MKINPIGIQSYQQVDQKEKPAVTDKNKALTAPAEKQVSIPGQSEAIGSKLSVKAPNGNYADFLTTEERQAMDLLFSRYRDSERFGLGYQKDVGGSGIKKTLGNVVDVKV